MADITMFAVETWVRTIATGEFHYKHVLNGTVDPKAYAKLREYIHRCCEKGICEPSGRKDGYYRPIQDLPLPVDWQNIPARVDFPIELPFDLRKYVFIYPNTIIIIAGSKSAGKTGFLYRTVAMNMKSERIKVVLLTNLEGGKEQLRDRFYAMDIEMPQPIPFTTIQVNDNFHDFIKQPNTLYVIDYIDAPEGTDFYLIGAAISKIRKKLDNSVAVIGLQKPRTRDTAFGGELTLREATLYIAMDSNKLKIVDAKVPADPRVIPKNLNWTFKYKDSGTCFVDVKRIGEITEDGFEEEMF